MGCLFQDRATGLKTALGHLPQERDLGCSSDAKVERDVCDVYTHVLMMMMYIHTCVRIQQSEPRALLNRLRPRITITIITITIITIVVTITITIISITIMIILVCPSRAHRLIGFDLDASMLFMLLIS